MIANSFIFYINIKYNFHKMKNPWLAKYLLEFFLNCQNKAPVDFVALKKFVENGQIHGMGNVEEVENKPGLNTGCRSR